MKTNKYMIITMFALVAAFAGVGAQAHWDEAQKQAFKDAKTACIADLNPAVPAGEKLTDAQRATVHQCLKAKGFDKHHGESMDKSTPMTK